MPTMKKQRVRRIKDDSSEQALLFIIFWLSVLVESIALYKREYIAYGISRMFVVPVLLLRSLRSPALNNIGLNFYLFLGLSFLADAFTSFGNYMLACIGHSLYTLGYLSLACWFLLLKKNNITGNIIFITTVLLLSIINSLWIYAPELHKQTLSVLISFHCIILLFTLNCTIRVSNKIGKSSSLLFLFGVLAIIFTNLLYGVDVLYLRQSHSWIDALVGIGNGLYLFVLTKGILQFAERTLKVTTEAIY